MLAAVRNFVIALLISAAVFGAIAWAITGFIAENVIGIADSPDTEDTTPVTVGTGPSEPVGAVPQPPAYPDLGGESFTVLLIGTDYRPDDFNDYFEDFKSGAVSNAKLGLLTRPIRRQSADLIMLVSIYEQTRRIVFSCIPGNTRVSVNGETRLLGECYDSLGVDAIIDSVNYLTAVPIDYYIQTNITDAGKIIDLIGGVDFDVPDDIENPYYNPDRTPENAPYSGITGERDFSTRTAIEEGRAHIDSSNLFALMHYRTPSAGNGARESMLVTFAQATLKRAVSPEYLGKAITLFSKAMQYIHTDMDENVLLANLDFFIHYEEFTLSTVTYPGTYSTLGDAECFVPSLEDAYPLYRTYRESEGARSAS